ncbi:MULTISPECIES: enoyl-CoA hydratase [unclassified Pseudomonas]|uniref:enoyl-CoA hydratase n=1 Tax=unclassified Pseudomonas TaxID=196821 RepID=UPI000BA3208E|nr:MULTISPECIES: enoyl-CoA hydratase [unclassified Pseudomonas]MCU1720400.1 enoyl-CoA hydratase [Pseudomonas sp. 5P_5.1_Bac1]MCU1734974.1 enoyl-CoA hydratase [Pseudomonas sp. 20P_3.2_Bac4]MCU1743449.1 enoyl-CoA hydratase [Pseudomonas sp. 20P_3.2_Bac5]
MSATDRPSVLLEFPAPGVALLRLDRPQASNALSLELQASLSRHFSELGADPEVRCILLTGGDKVFAAGGDITSMAGVGPIEIHQRHTERVWAPIQHCPKPVIAAVCGYAYGGGCELAMHADLIVAGRGAKFCQPEIRIGIMPGIGGTQRLVRAVGKAKAMRMALTGQPITAEEAWVAGLVSDLVEDDQVQARALELANVIAAMPALAAEQIKEVILAGMDAPLETGLALERKANALLFASQDQKEGMAAFIEKRPARFLGR